MSLAVPNQINSTKLLFSKCEAGFGMIFLGKNHTILYDMYIGNTISDIVHWF